LQRQKNRKKSVGTRNVVVRRREKKKKKKYSVQQKVAVLSSFAASWPSPRVFGQPCTADAEHRLVSGTKSPATQS
jgi:hypothetical protein